MGGLERLGLLGGVRVFRARVNFEFGQQHAAQAVLGHHAAHGAVDEFFGLPGANLGDGSALFPALPAGVSHVNFARFLLAGHADLFGVDDDHEVARIQVRGVTGLVAAPEKVGDLDRQPAQHGAVGVDDMPLPLVQIDFRQIGFHYRPKIRSGEGIKGRRRVNRHFGRTNPIEAKFLSVSD